MLEGKVWNIVKTELITPKILKAKVMNFEQLLISQDDKKLDLSIQNYCFSLLAETERCRDFESQRELLLKYIKRLVLFSNKVVLFGTIQISEINRLEFQVERNITNLDRSRWVKASSLSVD